MSSEERKSYFKDNEWDAFCLLPHPSGKGNLIYGLQAHRRFLQIAKRHLSGYKQLKEQIRVDALRDAIIHDFADRFVKRGEDISKDSV